ncbi:acetyl-CoA decarbonylase/synthase complex subunit delta [Thermosulfuriphilus ammonigenes]|uniref:Methylenetetrahydrofolate reductase n=1 Tax=Thermosulfuriphilus ammonigenes TaxID=1936021 RepID=A0A6G7PU19_9BACT|nr:acetyl-CoA decarbonylase/synthase complex subunit delta [Thermosulfuriphilus ammonigenes]MBA2848820.1 CO dehydrogenase/acetyl-CoA synthase delta subunit [Thermosulfuriphilus ammonigenes]QIJ71056.1 acetyl-CoA decarbonylase/synthase complex subunit delta [Thermosulfuriphilus ammonigenes]
MKSGSHLEKVLTSGEFAVTAEIGPPKNADPEVVLEKARLIKGYVDAANITDCQTAIVRMSSIASAVLIMTEGIEPVIQMTCRDRNRIAMQSDLLGAAALGIKNLLCLTGDHHKFGNHPQAKGVFDLDSIQMLAMVREMRDERRFQCGEEIKGQEPRFFLGAAANPFADPFEFRVYRLAKKIEAGADFIQTQIVYNVERFAKFMEMVRDLGLDKKVYILAGVTPFKSAGMANYMKKFVPGLDVPDDLLKRMKEAKDPREEGIKIAVEIIGQLREIPGVAGVHIMAIEWEAAVPEIVKAAGLYPRPEMEEVEPTVRLVSKEPLEVTPPKEEAPEEVAPEAPPQVTPPAAPSLPIEALKEVFSVLKAGIGDLMKGAEALTKGIAGLEETLLGAGAEARPSEPSPPSAEVPPPPEAPAEAEAPAEEARKREEEEKAAKVASLITAAKAALDAGDLDKAEGHFKEVLELEPENAPAREGLTEIKERREIAELLAGARTALEAEDLDKAKESFEAVLKLKPDHPEAKEGLSRVETLIAEREKEAKEAEPPKEEAPPAPVEALEFELAREEKSLFDRLRSIPKDVVLDPANGEIKEVTIGVGDKAIAAGGTNALPFHLFEGEMKNPPRIAMEVLDTKPEEWPEPLLRYFGDVIGDPAAWAKKCVESYQAEAICLYAVGADPNAQDRPAEEVAQVAKAVSEAVDVPLIIWGCGNAEKDTEVMRQVAEVVGPKNVLIGPVVDQNYRQLGATALAYQYPVVASSPIDVNLAKQLNILLENLGVPLERILMDPSIGALGYGLEYTYSVMERIRLAALYQQDDKLQVPFICNLGREVWKSKEAGLPSDDLLGDQERRAVLMEAITAVCMMLAGGDFLIMRHPRAIALAKALIKAMV